MKKINNALFAIIITLVFFECDKGFDENNSIIVGEISNTSLYLNDLEPDFEIGSSGDFKYYDFDFNGDSITDLSLSFKFTVSHFTLDSELKLNTFNDIKVLSDTSFLSIPKALGDTVFATEQFNAGEIIIYTTESADWLESDDYDYKKEAGHWKIGDDKYIVIKTEDNRLGWIRVELVDLSMFIIKEYAIQE